MGGTTVTKLIVPDVAAMRCRGFYIKNKGEITMKITLKDGSSKEYSEAKSVYEIAKDISEGLARVACAGEVDGEIVDLRTVLDKDCTLNIITASDEGRTSCHQTYSITRASTGSKESVPGCKNHNRTGN